VASDGNRFTPSSRLMTSSWRNVSMCANRRDPTSTPAMNAKTISTGAVAFSDVIPRDKCSLSVSASLMWALYPATSDRPPQAVMGLSVNVRII